MKPRLIQMLCPQRHAFLALAYDPAEESGEELQQQLPGKLQEKGIDLECALCHSRSFFFEDRELPFATLAEALPVLLRMQDSQLATREAILRGRARNN